MTIEQMLQTKSRILMELIRCANRNSAHNDKRKANLEREMVRIKDRIMIASKAIVSEKLIHHNRQHEI